MLSIFFTTIILVLTPTTHAQQADRVLGDNCESGQDFPVTVDGTLLVGCSTFSGERWCRRQDSTYVICPSFRDTSTPDTESLSPQRKHLSTPGTNVVISEFMVANNLFSDEDGETSDWIELHNGESDSVEFSVSSRKPVSLSVEQGWALTDDPEDLAKWPMPAITIESDGYAIIFASGKDRVSEEAAHTNFRLSIDGEYLALVRPDGSLASVIANEYPRQIPDISYGIPDYNGGAAGDVLMTFLTEPTPGEVNSGPLSTGPYISSVQHESEGSLHSPGMDITVTAVVTEANHPIDSVSLIYQVMFGEERSLPMRKGTQSADPVYSGVIPAEDFEPGEMVRWFIVATDVEGNEFRDPPLSNEEYALHYGTVIQQEVETGLPVLYWFSDNTEASLSEEGFTGAVFFEGEFYDNVFTRRRGVTALSWPKPKIKFDFKGRAFKYKKGESRVEEFNLQSFWEEIGEDSYLREPVAFQVHREAGVPASDSFHLVVRQNGEYFGLFAFVEQVDESFLERHGIKIGGELFKSVHGQFSNLRWDVKPDDLQFTYSKGNKKGADNWMRLWELTQGLAGGGPGTRSSFLFDFINIPQVINYMAVSNMLLNQDRCTKNFYVYKHPIDGRWWVFPWDTEASLGISSGLRGRPAEDYCILECEQWNSPFYCDSNHPQDLPGLVNLEIQTGRRLSQVTSDRTTPRNFKIPSVDDFNEDRTSTSSLTGAQGTYNHLDDAILDWAVTREMYLRRLRTLMDQFLNGRLERIITEFYELIQDDAVKDNSVWELADDVSKGYEQLITEQLPRRKEQLFDIYGPEGVGIIPSAQPRNAAVQVTSVETPGNREEQYIEISNSNDFAVDVSGWTLSGAVNFRFPEGTVIISEGSIFVTPNIAAFRDRGTSPKGGDAVLYVGPSSYMESGTTASDISVMDLQGQPV